MDAGAVQNIQAGAAKPHLLVVGGRTYIVRPNGIGSYAMRNSTFDVYLVAVVVRSPSPRRLADRILASPETIRT